MTVSVVIPTYNGARYLLETISSVVSQNVDGLEVLVVDDGSTDGTLDLVRSNTDPRIQLVGDGDRVGPAANWSRAVAAATRPYVKLIAQDDLLYPGNLAASVEALERTPRAAFAAVQRDVIGADGAVLLRGQGLGRLEGEVADGTLVRSLVRAGRNVVGEGACVLMRRSAAETTAGFDGSLPYAIDVDYWIRLVSGRSMVAIRTPLAAFRVHGESWSNELSRDQGAQFAKLIDRINDREGSALSSSDVLRGKAMAHMNSYGRALFYLRHRKHIVEQDSSAEGG